MSRSDTRILKQLWEARKNDQFFDDGPELFFVAESDSDADSAVSETHSESSDLSDSSIDTSIDPYDADKSDNDESSDESNMEVDETVKQEPAVMDVATVHSNEVAQLGLHGSTDLAETLYILMDKKFDRTRP